MRKKKLPTRVEILWNDIESDASWQDAQEVLTRKLPIMRSVGYLLRVTDKQVILAHTWTEDQSDSTRIPRGCILNVKKLTSAGTYNLEQK